MKFSLFGKGKRKGGPAEGAGQRVMQLSSQGLSEPEIIGSLKKEGYSPADVDSAMKEALKTEASGSRSAPRFPERDETLPGELLPGEPMERPLSRQPEGRLLEAGAVPPMERLAEAPLAEAAPPERGHREMDRPLRPEEVEGVPRMPEIPGESRLAPAEPADDLDEEPLEDSPMERPRPIPRRPVLEPEGRIPALEREPAPGASRESRIEEAREMRRRETIELTEELIEEKWAEVNEKLSEMNQKFKGIEAKVSAIEERFGKVKLNKGGEVRKMQKNVDNYMDSMADMNAKIEGLEKAVKTSLTPMMESMRNLSDTVKTMKRKKHKAHVDA